MADIAFERPVWFGRRPTRHDLMALSGIALENATDMAACFPEL